MNNKRTLLKLNLITSAKTLIVLRVIILSIFLGAVILFQLRAEETNIILPISIIIFTYILTIIYSTSLKFIKQLRVFCYIQIILDLIIETSVILTTGGIDSVFSFLYILSIISASIILIKPGNYIAAYVSGFLYSMVAYLEFNKIGGQFFLLSSEAPDGVYIIYKVFINVSAFFLVAYLSGYLGEKWRATGIELEVKSESLIELQRFNENVVKSMSSGLITTDLEGHITSFNRAAEDITNFKIHEVLGMNIYSFFKLAEIDRLMTFYKRNKEITIFRHEGVFERKDLNRIFIGMSLSSLKDDDGDNKGFIIIFQDLTGMKEMENKVINSEKMAAIGRIAAGMAHEIRNPLASMSGSIQLLQNELKLSGSEKRLMDIVIKETERLNSIINQFLNYASTRPVNVSKCNINDIINETIILINNNPEYKNKPDIITDFSENLLLNIDISQLKQVFLNLLLNSFDAMPDGGKINISTEQNTISEKEFIKISLSDQGYGMNQETLSNIFTPFYTTKDTGTGLGMSLVYRIIEKHKGTIDVKSKKGVGTDIRIFLPV